VADSPQPADAVDGGRRAGHDGDVVWIRERGDHGVDDSRRAAGERGRKPGHRAGLDGSGDIVGLAAVHADDHDVVCGPRYVRPLTLMVSIT